MAAAPNSWISKNSLLAHGDTFQLQAPDRSQSLRWGRQASPEELRTLRVLANQHFMNSVVNPRLAFVHTPAERFQDQLFQPHDPIHLSQVLSERGFYDPYERENRNVAPVDVFHWHRFNKPIQPEWVEKQRQQYEAESHGAIRVEAAAKTIDTQSVLFHLRYRVENEARTKSHTLQYRGVTTEVTATRPKDYIA
ncbi:MAG: hypothetical protein SFZ03_08485 [Candidatus Melainabacteria bacterium]|nr:hypothetical protein [Candidatus Melainabacteria bacterium]